MKHTKATKAIHWTCTTLIFLFEGVVPALTSETEVAVEGMRHLGYTDYFRTMLVVFKVLGAVVLIVPAFKAAVKEWAYAGFTFVFLSAAISHWAVDGFDGQTIFPLVVLAILAVSYFTYHKLSRLQNATHAIA